MAIPVKFLSAFQEQTQGKTTFFVEEGQLSQIFGELQKEIPGLKEKLWDKEGKIHPAYNVILIRGDTQQLCHDLNSKVKEGDELIIIPIISGG
jgi:molybdopterin converting factor small subunit